MASVGDAEADAHRFEPDMGTFFLSLLTSSIGAIELTFYYSLSY